MFLRRLSQPLTAKSALLAVGLLVLGVGLFFGGRAGLRWLEGRPKSTAQVKRQIWRYLRQQTGRRDFDKAAYNFNLKETVAQAHTNLALFRAGVSTLQSNLSAATAQVRLQRNACEKLREQERRLRQEVRNLEAMTGERQQRLTNRLAELSLIESNSHRAATNAAAASRQAEDIHALTVRLTNEISALLSNLAAATPGTVSRTNAAPLRKDLAEKQQQLSQARRQLAEKRADLTGRERVMAAARASLASAQGNVTMLGTNAAAAAQSLEAKRTAWLAAQKEFEAGTNALALRQQEAGALHDQYQARSRELPERQRDVQAREQELRTQMAAFRTDIRQKVAQASSYENIYYLIGQQLYVADKLLASQDPVEHQQALTLACEAAQQAAQGAEQLWLAARICEAYLLPNVSLADAKGRIGFPPESILSQCANIFERAEDTSNLLKSLRLALDRAGTNAPTRVDAIRFQLAYALEQAGQYTEALNCYRQMQDSNWAARADRRIAVVNDLQQQQQQQRAQK